MHTFNLKLIVVAVAGAMLLSACGKTGVSYNSKSDEQHRSTDSTDVSDTTGNSAGRGARHSEEGQFPLIESETARSMVEYTGIPVMPYIKSVLRDNAPIIQDVTPLLRAENADTDVVVKYLDGAHKQCLAKAGADQAAADACVEHLKAVGYWGAVVMGLGHSYKQLRLDSKDRVDEWADKTNGRRHVDEKVLATEMSGIRTWLNMLELERRWGINKLDGAVLKDSIDPTRLALAKAVYETPTEVLRKAGERVSAGDLEVQPGQFNSPLEVLVVDTDEYITVGPDGVEVKRGGNLYISKGTRFGRAVRVTLETSADVKTNHDVKVTKGTSDSTGTSTEVGISLNGGN